MRYLIRRTYYFPVDIKDKLSGNSHPYIPSRGKIFTGSAVDARKYLKEARHQVDLLKRYAGLTPHGSVLDVGSGLGRTAIALSEFLSKEAQYEGFDVVEKGGNGVIKELEKIFRISILPMFHLTTICTILPPIKPMNLCFLIQTKILI